MTTIIGDKRILKELQEKVDEEMSPLFQAFIETSHQKELNQEEFWNYFTNLLRKNEKVPQWVIEKFEK